MQTTAVTSVYGWLTDWPTTVVDVAADPPTVIAVCTAVMLMLLLSAAHTGARALLAGGYAVALAVAAGLLDAAVWEGQDAPLAAVPVAGAALAGLDTPDVAVLALLAAVGVVAAVVTDVRWVRSPAARARHWHTGPAGHPGAYPPPTVPPVSPAAPAARGSYPVAGGAARGPGQRLPAPAGPSTGGRHTAPVRSTPGPM